MSVVHSKQVGSGAGEDLHETTYVMWRKSATDTIQVGEKHIVPKEVNLTRLKEPYVMGYPILHHCAVLCCTVVTQNYSLSLWQLINAFLKHFCML